MANRSDATFSNFQGLSSPDPKAHKASLYGRTRAGDHVTVCELAISNMNISKTRGQLQTNFI